MPAARHLDELNGMLLDGCREDEAHLIDGREQTVGEALAIEAPASVPLDSAAPILHLVNLKQRPQRGGHLPRKAVIVSPNLVAALRALTNDAHVAYAGYFFRSGDRPGASCS